jgi:hypothetical protein
VNKKKSEDTATTEEATTTEAAPEGATTAPEAYTGPTARLAPSSAPRTAPERQVNVADWAATKMERREIGGQLAYAFVQGYPTDTATPSELEQALQAFRSRPIKE